MRRWYKGAVPDLLKELLADPATTLIHASFTNVRATWWWERRINGGIEICQELDPAVMARDISERTGTETPEVRRVIERELGLEDDDPVVLTFEISGETTSHEVSQMLAERSSEPEGLAVGLYRQVEEAVGSSPR